MRLINTFPLQFIGSGKMGYFAKLFPPFYKYAVFLFVGFEFVYSAIVLAISEAYYKSTSNVLPIAYKMFEDTLKKRKPGFDWTPAEQQILETHKNELLILWIISIIGVLLCMLVIIPQFFDFNDKRGNPSHLCLVRRTIAWILYIAVAIYVIILGIAVVYLWSDGGAARKHFLDHFEAAEKEEQFISEIERVFLCESDDDNEVEPQVLCYRKIRHSLISEQWLDLLLLVYIVGHVLAFLAVPLFNKQLVKEDIEDDVYNNTNGKLLEA
ncbi:unnamed protein product [Caenorhabditis angaria]|uniref:Uncharacterized protein n=1 Tax=Caenorhabditis angaria TaxID=860376 RepID=A0A9P1ID65_9PELO|nr:unnamed protein product [Caenorhabditis angaria]